MLGRFKKRADRIHVDVAATLTLMAGPFDLAGDQHVNVEVTNPSGVDTIDAQLEFATLQAGPWTVVPSDQWKGIVAGETRNEGIEKLAKTWCRFRGKSLGASILSVTVSLHSESV